jgi:hypothetical protein
VKEEKNITRLKEALEDLPTKIREIIEFEVGLDFNKTDRACDISLYSSFETKEDLKAYAIHPEHLKVVEIVKEVTEYTKVVDYEN